MTRVGRLLGARVLNSASTTLGAKRSITAVGTHRRRYVFDNYHFNARLLVSADRLFSIRLVRHDYGIRKSFGQVT